MQNLDEENPIGCNSEGKFGVVEPNPYDIYENRIGALEQWHRDMQIKEIENMRFRLDCVIDIGDQCVFVVKGSEHVVYFGIRRSENWYITGETEIRAEDILHVVALKEVPK